MIKKVLWLAGLIMLLSLLYIYGIPAFSRPAQTVEDPVITAAIGDYVKHHLPEKVLGIPPNSENWLVEDITIHQLKDLPGPHHRKSAETTVCGYYQIPRGEYRSPKRKSFKTRLLFNIGDKYPSGISVQLIK
jgi:hypothetical protein